jgi:hypothetical protein
MKALKAIYRQARKIKIAYANPKWFYVPSIMEVSLGIIVNKLVG